MEEKKDIPEKDLRYFILSELNRMNEEYPDYNNYFKNGFEAAMEEILEFVDFYENK